MIKEKRVYTLNLIGRMRLFRTSSYLGKDGSFLLIYLNIS